MVMDAHLFPWYHCLKVYSVRISSIRLCILSPYTLEVFEIAGAILGSSNVTTHWNDRFHSAFVTTHHILNFTITRTM